MTDPASSSENTLTVRLDHDFDAFGLHVSFDAPPGITALFGPSGAGKTSVINALAGLLRPQNGYGAIGAHVLFDSSRKLFVPPNKRHMGYVFQDSRLFPHMSVEKNLLYGNKLRSAGEADGLAIDRDRIVELLNLGDLLHRLPHALSGGERQRVAIGRALLSVPRYLLMDEPLASLDGPRRLEILPFLEWLRDNHRIPIVYVSHNAEEVVRLADTVVIVKNGRVVRAGAVEDLFDALTADAGAAPDEGILASAGSGDLATLVTATAREHVLYDGLTRLDLGGGVPLFIPKVEVTVGRKIRVRIYARDVALSLKAPEGTSVLNSLPARVAEIDASHPTHADLRLVLANGLSLWSRISKRSLRLLDLQPGRDLWAMVKTVALESGVSKPTRP